MIYADMSSYVEIVCLLLDTFGFDLCLIFAAVLCKLLHPCIIKSSLINRKLPCGYLFFNHFNEFQVLVYIRWTLSTLFISRRRGCPGTIWTSRLNVYRTHGSPVSVDSNVVSTLCNLWNHTSEWNFPIARPPLQVHVMCLWKAMMLTGVSQLFDFHNCCYMFNVRARCQKAGTKTDM